jgi:acyl-CoA thioesterase-1
MSLQQNDHIVFFGDSITDCGRNRDAQPGEHTGWGGGYVYQIAAALSAELPDYELKFTNKGISGNRIYDLEARLDQDVLSHDPDVVSILIGINDVWRRYDSGKESELSEFVASYRRVLEKIEEQGAQIVILEPFLLPVPEDRKAWREDLDPKINAIRELAREFEAILIPLDGIFAAASCKRESAFWAADGVHPSPAGHALIANAWQEAVVD